MRFFTKPSGLAILGLLCVLAAAVPSARADFLFVISSGGTIEELDSSGHVVNSNFATVSGATSLAFNAGDLFIGSSNGSIYEVTPSGVTTFASGFSSPVLAFNASGDLFVGNSNGTIKELDSSGHVINPSFASISGSVAALAFNSAGDLFVANGSSSNSISYVTPSGSVNTFSSATPPSGVGWGAGLAFDGSGNLYYATGAGHIYEVTSSSYTPITNVGSNLAGTGALAINSSGDLFVSGSGGSTQYIYEVTPSGSFRQFASVSDPAGLAFQPAISTVPAPSSLVLFGLGFGGLGLFYRLMRGRKPPYWIAAA